MNAGNWNKLVLTGTIAILALVGGVTAYIDPFLHYHGPLAGFSYPLKDERYENDGIGRHYEYDSVITGTSMTQNFLCSEFDRLWSTKSIKTSYSGASLHELREGLERNFTHRDGIRYVLCSLDLNTVNYEADADEYEGYPDYLYDDSPWNDTKYLFNKEVALKTLAVINYTRAGNATTSRDEYGAWGAYQAYGKEAVFNSFSPLPVSETEYHLSEEDMARIRENLEKNVVSLANAHPDTQFIYFIPPYSICYWNALVRSGQLPAVKETMEIICEELLSIENIHLYDFYDRTEIVSDLDNYMDTLHYGPWINSEILRGISDGSAELLRDNYEEHLKKVFEIYANYDYEKDGFL